jgi:hypothetical protein
MDLLQHLKQARAKPKEPFTRTAFTVVSALVQAHKLDGSFLQNLRDFSIQRMDWLACEPQAKEPFAPPLFPLVSDAECRLTQAILAAADNPYLRFAHSPAELLLSGPLFRFNPELQPAILARVHFHTLLAREIVRTEIQDLRRRLKEGAAPAAESREPEEGSAAGIRFTETRDRLTSLESRLDRLNAFIDQSMP